MRAVTWQGKRKVSVDTVPDPKIVEPTDAIIKVTTTNICGSDLHLYETLGAFMNAGDILGHEPMGIVEEVGSEVTNLEIGDRVVIPFQISCGNCFMCDSSLYTQCETTQVRDQGTGAALFGFSELYGSVPGGQAEYLRVPQAHFTHIKVPEGPADSRFVYLSDVLPTAWQSVEYASIPAGGSVTVLGLKSSSVRSPFTYTSTSTPGMPCNTVTVPVAAWACAGAARTTRASAVAAIKSNFFMRPPRKGFPTLRAEGTRRMHPAGTGSGRTRRLRTLARSFRDSSVGRTSAFGAECRRFESCSRNHSPRWPTEGMSGAVPGALEPTP